MSQTPRKARSTAVRRVLLVALASLAILAVVAGVAATSMYRGALPQTEGEIDLEGLSATVRVLRDDHGIPQLYGDSVGDLAMAQGYVHAQDRFFEMDLRRHLASGRLAELIGADGVESDRVVRAVGLRQVAEAELPILEPSTRQFLQSYAAGVNAWISTHSGSDAALEYAVLDLDLPSHAIEEWTPVDSLVWLKAFAWDLKADYADELTRARLSARMPQEQILELYPSPDLESRPPILGPDEWSPQAAAVSSGSSIEGAVATLASAAAYDEVARALAAIPALAGRGAGIGSNSWVVAGSLTASGEPMLAADPHLAATAPSMWYQMGMHCSDVTTQCPLDTAGFSVAGMPGIVMGHNASMAWALTSLAPDVTDFALERMNSSGQYLVDGEWTEPQTRTETITVRGGSEVTLTVRSTGNGPILSDVLSEVSEASQRPPTPDPDDVGRAYAVTLRWTGLTPGTSADALTHLALATTPADLRSAAALLTAPALNIVYATVDGQIGYQSAGAIPVREPAIGTTPGFWPVPGWESRYDWTGTVPFESLPQVVDPADGVIVAANQTVTGTATPFLTTEADQGFRATRIAELLADQGSLDPAAMAGIQTDDVDTFAPVLVEALLEVDLGSDSFTAEARDLLTTWDHSNPVEGEESSAAAYYHAVWANLLEIVFNDELPTDLWPDGGARWQAVIVQLLANPTSVWWDDKSTPGVVEGRDAMLREALIQARLELTRSVGKDPTTWHWGLVHRLDGRHPVMSAPTRSGWVRSLFEVGPVPLPGGSTTVDANGWDAAEGFAVTTIPSARMVVDLGALDDSTWVSSTGASGHPASGHWDDQLDVWASGAQLAWPSSATAIEAAAVQILLLQPPSS